MYRAYRTVSSASVSSPLARAIFCLAMTARVKPSRKCYLPVILVTGGSFSSETGRTPKSVFRTGTGACFQSDLADEWRGDTDRSAPRTSPVFRAVIA